MAYAQYAIPDHFNFLIFTKNEELRQMYEEHRESENFSITNSGVDLFCPKTFIAYPDLDAEMQDDLLSKMYDLEIVGVMINDKGEPQHYHVGPRSSTPRNTKVRQANAPAVIEEEYIGTLKACIDFVAGINLDDICTINEHIATVIGDKDRKIEEERRLIHDESYRTLVISFPKNIENLDCRVLAGMNLGLSTFHNLPRKNVITNVIHVCTFALKYFYGEKCSAQFLALNESLLMKYSTNEVSINKGNRLFQAFLGNRNQLPYITTTVVTDSEPIPTARGTGGYGSTGA